MFNMIKDNRYLIILFLISISFSLFFIIVFQHPVVSDAAIYDAIAWNIASGNGFSREINPPFIPTMLREPLYPFLLSIIYRIFGHNYLAVKLFQGLLFSFTCIIAFFLACQISNKKIAKYSTIAIGLFPTLANYPSYLLTETIFTFLLCLTVLVLTFVVKNGKIFLFFIAGILLGMAALCKNMMILFFLPVLSELFLSLKNFSYSFKKKFICFIIFTCTFITVITPWIYRNYLLFKYSNISLRGELVLWMRANKLDDTLEESKQALVYNFSEFLGHILYPNAVQIPSDFILDDSRKAYQRMEELSKENYSLVEANRIIKKEALEKIKRRPIKYFMQSFLELEKMLAFTYIPTLNEPHIINIFYKLQNGKVFLFVIRGFFRLIAYFIIILAAFGVIAKKKQWHKHYFPLAIIIYINLIHSLLFGLGRFAVPLLPFYLIFAIIGFNRLIKKFQSSR